MITLGFDCGITGAVCALGHDGSYLDVRDLPVASNGHTKWIDGQELLSMLIEWRDGNRIRAIVERTQVMGKAGAIAANSKGLTLGSVLATLQIAGIGFELVTPKSWKAHFNLIAPKLTDSQRKAASLSLGRQLFPTAPLDRVKDNGRAEALLIAQYALRYQAAKEAA